MCTHSLKKDTYCCSLSPNPRHQRNNVTWSEDGCRGEESQLGTMDCDAFTI